MRNLVPEPQPSATRIRILIADAYPLVRYGLRRLLQEDPDFLVVGDAEDGNEAIALTRQLRPDILFLDVAMPCVNGIQVLQELARMLSPTRSILLTAAIDGFQFSQALNLGARGVVTKTAPLDLLKKSIRCVHSGQYWIDRKMIVNLIARQQSPPPYLYGLTPRELELVREIAAGKFNKDIANQLGISEKTVKRHLASIFEKLSVSSRLELAVFALNHGLVSQDPPMNHACQAA